MNNVNILTQDAPEVKAENAEKKAMKENRQWTQKSLKSISRRDNRVQASREQSSDWALWA